MNWYVDYGLGVYPSSLSFLLFYFSSFARTTLLNRLGARQLCEEALKFHSQIRALNLHPPRQTEVVRTISAVRQLWPSLLARNPPLDSPLSTLKLVFLSDVRVAANPYSSRIGGGGDEGLRPLN